MKSIGDCLTSLFASCSVRYFALVSCTLVLWAELSRHPFKSSAYDFIEEFTTLTEVALLLNGIVVLSRKNDGSLEWLEPVVWVFLGASFLLVIAITLVDLGVHLCLQWVSKVRAAKHVRLSPAIFDLQIKDYLLPRFVEQAGPDELRALRAVEDCMARLIQRGLFVHSVQDENMLKMAPTALDYVIKRGGGTNPHMANGLLDPHFISKVMTDVNSPPSGGNDFGLEPGLSSRDSDDGLINDSNVADSDDILKGTAKYLPSAFFFNDLLLGSVLSFCDQKATPNEIQDLATLFAAVQKFEARERSKKHSLLETVQRMINELGLLKHTQAKNKLLASVLASKQQGNGKKKHADFKVCFERVIAPPCPCNRTHRYLASQTLRLSHRSRSSRRVLVRLPQERKSKGPVRAHPSGLASFGARRNVERPQSKRPHRLGIRLRIPSRIAQCPKTHRGSSTRSAL